MTARIFTESLRDGAGLNAWQGLHAWPEQQEQPLQLPLTPDTPLAFWAAPDTKAWPVFIMWRRFFHTPIRQCRREMRFLIIDENKAFVRGMPPCGGQPDQRPSSTQRYTWKGARDGTVYGGGARICLHH